MNRCMIYHKEFSKKLWIEVASTIVFIQNCLLTQVLQNQTPSDVWFKLEKRAELRMLIGYKTISNAYENFQPQIGNIFGK